MTENIAKYSISITFFLLPGMQTARQLIHALELYYMFNFVSFLTPKSYCYVFLSEFDEQSQRAYNDLKSFAEDLELKKQTLENERQEFENTIERKNRSMFFLTRN